MQDAGYLWARGIVGTYSSRKPPRHRNNSYPARSGDTARPDGALTLPAPTPPNQTPRTLCGKPETGLPEEGGASRVISPQPSTVTGTRESHGGCVNRAHTRPPDLARFHQPLCCLMASESFGCHDISRHRWGGPAGRESCCFGLSDRGCPGRSGGCRPCLAAVHEGGVLLEEGGVHFG